MSTPVLFSKLWEVETQEHIFFDAAAWHMIYTHGNVSNLITTKKKFVCPHYLYLFKFPKYSYNLL